jgi:hypothetical protein
MLGHVTARDLLLAVILGALGVLGALLFLGLIGNRGSARFGNGKVEFPPSRASLWSGLVIIGYFLESAVRHLARNHSTAADWLIQGALLVGALAMLSTLPGTIALSDEGLEQIYWFRGRTRLAWDGIVEVKLDARTVTIRGEDGTRIAHTSQNVDRARLLVELKHHCGDDLPPEFPGVPKNRSE